MISDLPITVSDQPNEGGLVQRVDELAWWSGEEQGRIWRITGQQTAFRVQNVCLMWRVDDAVKCPAKEYMIRVITRVSVWSMMMMIMMANRMTLRKLNEDRRIFDRRRIITEVRMCSAVSVLGGRTSTRLPRTRWNRSTGSLPLSLISAAPPNACRLVYSQDARWINSALMHSRSTCTLLSRIGMRWHCRTRNWRMGKVAGMQNAYSLCVLRYRGIRPILHYVLCSVFRFHMSRIIQRL